MYTFFYDAGHAWLQVSKQEIKTLNLEDKISEYSYMRNDFVYLEEDCDAMVFINAKNLTENDIIEQDDGNYSRIRSFSRFNKNCL